MNISPGNSFRKMLLSKGFFLTHLILTVYLLSFCSNIGQAGQVFSSSSSDDKTEVDVNSINDDEAENQADQNEDQAKEAIESQALNTYLTQLELVSVEPVDVIPHLEAALDIIESLGIDEFSKLDPENTDLDVKFKPLVGDYNTKIIHSILQQLLSASNSCSQESFDFLSPLVERRTFDGQLLNKYARVLLARCWIDDLNTMPRKIDQKIGKMNSSLFELIAKLAKLVHNSMEREQTPKESIVINDLEPPRILEDLLRQLKQVTFETDKQRRMFAKAIYDHFKLEQQASEKVDKSKLEEFYNISLIASCGELVDKMHSVLWKLGLSSKYSPSNSDESIRIKRLNNQDLDHKLEVYRICKQLRSNDSSIWTILSGMR